VCVFLGASPRPVGAAPLPRLVVSLPQGTPAVDFARVMAASGLRDGVIVLPPVAARIGGTGPAVEAGLPAIEAGGLGSGLDPYLHVIVTVGDVSGTGRDREAFIDNRVSDIVSAALPEILPVKGLIVEVEAAGAPPEVVQFAAASLMVKARSAKPGLHVSLMLPDDALDRPGDAMKRLVAYADSVALRRQAPSAAAGQPLADLVAGKPIVQRLAAASALSAARAFLDLLVTTAAPAADLVWIDPPDAASLRELCASYQFLARVLGTGFEMTAPERAPAAVMLDGKPAGQAAAFIGSGTADVAVLLRTGATRALPRTLSVAAPSTEALLVTCYDALDGRRLPGGSDSRTGAGCSAEAEYALVHVARGGGEGRLFEAVNVPGRADLRVEEIIARWQAAREVERRALQNYVALCFLKLHFESNTYGVGFDLAFDLRQFYERSGVNDWIQTGLLVNGVRLKKVQEFPLPQLEPERVVTKPLELAIDEKYEYRLAGTDTVSDRLCYVVDIEPSVSRELLFSGRIWIDGLTFRQVRMRLEQRTALNSVAAHVETQDFAPVRDATGREFMLFQRIFAEETLNIGGRPVMLERTYLFEDYAVNVPDFEPRLADARKTDAPMYRDTEGGLRSLRREGDTLVVEPSPGKRIRSLVGGVIVDASVGFPVPLAGLSWADFDYRHSGSQLSAVFAGALFAANLSKERSKSVRTSVEFSLSALPSTLRTYQGDAEVTGEQVRMFEQTAGVIVNWQATSALTLSASSHVALHPFMRTGSTDPAYRTPSLGLNLRAWVEARYVRRSFEAVTLVEPVLRVAGWGPYGWEADGYTDPPRAYVRYDAEVNKHLYVGKLSRGGVSASYYGSWNVDRFSRYQSSFILKPRIVGLPAGVDSFDTIVLAGAYYGFNVMDFIKLEGSYNHAWARNLEESTAFRQFDGMDFDIGTAGPWGTYIQAAVGYTLRGNLDRYSARWGAQVLVFKPLSN
jgi:hypothetical protein